LTPFEREYGVPDLPGGWPGFDIELDDETLRRRLVVGKDSTVESAMNSEKIEVVSMDEQERPIERESRRDIRVTKLVVHPIKVS
jgi:hypothetical protein